MKDYKLKTSGKKIVGIIPARIGSTRLKEKPLIELAGKTIIQRVYERARLSSLLEKVIVATDNIRIFDKVREFGGEVIMTDEFHKSGTDRAAEAAIKIKADIIVNIQGDEPTIAPQLIDKTIEPLLKDDSVYFATLKTRIRNTKDLLNPNVVKVITDRSGFAIYFSRSPIPYSLDLSVFMPYESHIFSEDKTETDYFKHIGLYVYRKDFLLKYISLERGTLEKIEKLEQLRAIEHGYKIKVVETDEDSISIDTEEDLDKAKIFLLKNNIN